MTDQPMEQTVFAQVSEALYANMLADDELSPFFCGMNVQQIEHRQTQFLQVISDTSEAEFERISQDLRRIHAPLLAQGLNHSHFDRMVEHLSDALQEVQVEPSVQSELLARIETFRPAVVGENYSQFQNKENSMIGRITSMIYAVVCYTLGMAVLAYSAAWLGDFALPTTVDSAGVNFTVTALLINLALVLMFAVQHSVMARPWFKAAWTKIIPAQTERATYILTSSIAMFAMMWYWQPMGGDIWRLEGTALTIMYVVYGIGWFVLVSSTFFLNHFDLFGLRQAWLHLRGKPYTHIPFRTPGYYKLVRHPIYVGWLIVIWAAPAMTVTHLAFAVLTTIYIVMAIPYEERDLEEMLPEYADYKSATPSLIPGAGGKATVKA